MIDDAVDYQMQDDPAPSPNIEEGLLDWSRHCRRLVSCKQQNMEPTKSFFNIDKYDCVYLFLNKFLLDIFKTSNH